MRTTDTTTSDREDDPLTERLLADAGVGPGMRVLDLGTGAGDVALLAARIVGPSGRVVSVDRDLRTLMLAAVRCEREEIEHVDLAVGDLAVPVLPEGGFDAVVARSVLLDLPDPARTLRAAAARLRPGGVVCIQEGAENPREAAPRLRRTFAAAGLATPAVRDGSSSAVGAWARVAAA
jgi:ubiquinone/menaquinone biosynthesis C-methylase UbiE